MHQVIPLVVAATAIITYAAGDTKVICYYASWNSYHGYNPEDFDATLCTHVNYAFAVLWDDGNLKVEDDSLDIDQGLFSRVAAMKDTNPDLKVLLSVGGGLEGLSDTFASIATDPDWEYPTPEQSGDYITLLQELKQNFTERGWLLTSAVSADPKEGYAPEQINSILDWLNVMTYDMYGYAWSDYTGQNSALYPSSLDTDYERENLNLAAAANNWVTAGVSKEKLAIGVPFFGKTFTLADENQHGIHAPITGPGLGAEAPSAENYNDWAMVWDDEQKTLLIGTPETSGLAMMTPIQLD
ncbi:hypothetical protein NQ317_005193 [Molorchus minor]|uniref:GH18 domain-containing protein n=1 Tax=Molorchus minor TaxID=1323400 RepID=A0ABQ9J0L8_9CUCU|nr:hypothetical protein NQ317_005193 [Molorchus minor]